MAFRLTQEGRFSGTCRPRLRHLLAEVALAVPPLVRPKGFEPPRVTPLGPKPSASTSSATAASRKWLSKDELAGIRWARETEGQTIVIEAEEIPDILKAIRVIKKCKAFYQCLEDRDREKSKALRPQVQS